MDADSNNIKSNIQALQSSMLDLRCSMPKPRHLFAPGMYGRELIVPAGMLIVGKIHKHSHLLMVLQGKAIIVSEFGKEVVEAGHFSVSQAGVKRVVYALEDTTFVTVHHNPEDVEDLEIIEAEHIEDENFDLDYHKQVIGLLL